MKMLENIKETGTIKQEHEGDIREKNIFHLFVAGKSGSSAKAIANMKAICEKTLKGKCELKIIDIYEQPSLAYEEKIIAIPVLIKKFPLPEERVIGDLSNTEKVLRGLYLV